MRRSVRLVVTTCAALATLVFAGSAWGAYTPRLIATSLNNAPSKPTTMILGHFQDDADDAPAIDTIYAPLGYQVNLAQPAGTKIGDVSTTLILRGAGNEKVTPDGQLIADSPAAHLNDPCAPGLHGAVWKLNVTVTGTLLTVNVYVDAITAGPEAVFASAKIQLCLPDPLSSPSGAQFVFALFDVKKVFTNPPSRADRIWRGTFTPYTANTPNPNPAAQTEGQARVPARVSLTLASKSLKRGVVIISGRLLVNGKAFANAPVELYVGIRKVADAKTNRAGRFTIRKRIKKKTRYLALVSYVGDLAGCPAAPLPGVPQGCKTATMSFITISNTVTARRKR